MGDEQKPPVTPAKSGTRRFTYDGKVPANKKKVLLVGHEQIKPWEMTDEQIEAFIKRHPGQADIWKDADKK